MIISNKGNTVIGSKTISIFIYIDLNDSFYELGIGPKIDVEKMANDILYDKDFFSEIFGSFVGKYFKNIQVYHDDCYEGHLVKDADPCINPKFSKDHIELLDKIIKYTWPDNGEKYFIRICIYEDK